MKVSNIHFESKLFFEWCTLCLILNLVIYLQAKYEEESGIHSKNLGDSSHYDFSINNCKQKDFSFLSSPDLFNINRIWSIEWIICNITLGVWTMSLFILGKWGTRRRYSHYTVLYQEKSYFLCGEIVLGHGKETGRNCL